MRLAETLLDSGSVLEAEQYATAGVTRGRGHASARVFSELLGLASTIYATLGDHASSEKMVNEAAALSVGSTSQATAGGIGFGETAASTYQLVEALRRGDARAAGRNGRRGERARRALALADGGGKLHVVLVSFCAKC